MDKPGAQEQEQTGYSPAIGARPVCRVGDLSQARKKALVQERNQRLGLETDVLAPVFRGITPTYRGAVHPFTIGGAPRNDEYTAAFKSHARRRGVPLSTPYGFAAISDGAGVSGRRAAAARSASAAPADAAPSAAAVAVASAAAAATVAATAGPSDAEMYGAKEPRAHAHFAETLAAWLGVEPIKMPLLAPGAPPLSLRQLFSEVHDASPTGSRKRSSGHVGHGSGSASWPALARKLLGKEELSELLKQVYDAYLLPLERRMPASTRATKAEAWMAEDLRLRKELEKEGVAATAQQVSARLKVALAAIRAYDPCSAQQQQAGLVATPPAGPGSLAVSVEAAAAAATAAVISTGAAVSGTAAVQEAVSMAAAAAAAAFEAAVKAGAAGSSQAAGASDDQPTLLGAAPAQLGSAAEVPSASGAMGASAAADAVGPGVAGLPPQPAAAIEAPGTAAGAPAEITSAPPAQANVTTDALSDGAAVATGFAGSPVGGLAAEGQAQPAPAAAAAVSLAVEVLRALCRAAATPATLLPAPPPPPSKRKGKGGKGRKAAQRPSKAAASAGKKRPRGAEVVGEGGEDDQAAAGASGAAGTAEVDGEVWGLSGPDLTDGKASALLSIAASLRQCRAGPPGCGIRPPDLEANFRRRWEAERAAQQADQAAEAAAAVAAAAEAAVEAAAAATAAVLAAMASRDTAAGEAAEGAGRKDGGDTGHGERDVGGADTAAADGPERKRRREEADGANNTQRLPRAPLILYGAPADGTRRREHGDARSGGAPSGAAGGAYRETGSSKRGSEEHARAEPRGGQGSARPRDREQDGDRERNHGRDRDRDRERGREREREWERDNRDRERDRDRDRDREREQERGRGWEHEHRGRQLSSDKGWHRESADWGDRSGRHAPPPAYNSSSRPQPRFPALASVAPPSSSPSPPPPHHHHHAVPAPPPPGPPQHHGGPPPPPHHNHNHHGHGPYGRGQGHWDDYGPGGPGHGSGPGRYDQGPDRYPYPPAQHQPRFGPGDRGPWE